MKTSHTIKNALRALSLIEISVGIWTGNVKLQKGGRDAAVAAGANPSVASMHVNLMGANAKALAAVVSKFKAIRTFFDANTVPFRNTGRSGARGPKLIPKVRIPKVWATLTAMKKDAFEALEEFLKDYEDFRNLAISEDMGKWAKEAEAKYPTVDALRAKFRVDLFPPAPLPCDAESMRNDTVIPADLAGQFADQMEQQLTANLDRVKDAAIRNAEAHMETVAKQLTQGQRLHASLLENAKHVSAMLREITVGYDNDPRVIAMADLIDKKVANVSSTQVWKDFPAKAAESASNAEKVVKAIKQYSAKRTAPKSAQPKAAPKAAPSSTPKGKSKIAVGGAVGRAQAKRQNANP